MKKENIFVSMSGGVDSSLAAALLKKQGHNVTGITIKLWCYETKPDTEKACCSLQAVNDAKEVAHSLNIPHYVWNMEKDFRKTVLETFCSEYMSGHTPNPCVLCNAKLRFDIMLNRCLNMGADAMATGHYAQIRFLSDQNRYALFKGMDNTKDQSYFLCGIPAGKLQNIRFPLGNITKKETRTLAKSFGLKTSEKKESQDLCFAAEGKYSDILKELYDKPFQPGEIRNSRDNLLGTHKGLCFYTIGQRRGLGIAAGHPLYVTGLEAKNNILRVGCENELFSKDFAVSNINWFDPITFKKTIECSVSIRSTHKGSPALIEWTNTQTIKVSFKEPQRSISPGQSAVFYDNNELLGGGIIQ
ncbi:MAG: tRNA 2-thiouridine(34) synthase MnmA [Candidatus Theseobacter exili]|nr:tRNA 2-thiouridine(34) synthase MnmA [Candidatus Theseobacter exili]